MGRTITNPRTGEQSLNNEEDVGRKWPTSALADRALTELEGVNVETITGPDAVGAAPANEVLLSRPVSSVKFIFSYVTASGAAGAVAAPLPTTHWTLDVGPGGVGRLTNPSIVDFTAETWVVFYHAETAEGPGGGASTVTPGP